MNSLTNLFLLGMVPVLALQAQTTDSALLGLTIQQPAKSVLAQPGNEKGLRDRLGPVASKEGLSCGALELSAVTRDSRNGAAVDREHARLRRALEAKPFSKLLEERATEAGHSLVYRTGSGGGLRLVLLTKTNDVLLLGGCEASKAGAAAPAAPGKGGLEGLYVRMVSSWNGRYSTFEPQHLLFRKDGRYFEGVPAGGMGNFEAACGKDPRHCGTYTMEGTKLVFQPGTGAAWKADFERADGQNLRLGGLFTRRVETFAPGKRLAGKFTYMAAGSRGSSFLSGAQAFTFDAGGRFALVRSGTGSMEAGNASAAGRSESAYGGEYELRGYDLVLRYADGRVTTHTIYPFSDESHKEIYNIDGRNFFRE